jgi:hypothetical protein
MNHEPISPATCPSLPHQSGVLALVLLLSHTPSTSELLKRPSSTSSAKGRICISFAWPKGIGHSLTQGPPTQSDWFYQGNTWLVTP